MNPFNPGDLVTATNPNCVNAKYHGTQRIQDVKEETVRFQDSDWWHFTHWKLVTPGVVSRTKMFKTLNEISSKAKLSLTDEKTNPKETAGSTKCPMHLLPPEFLIQTANAMGYGATKYGPYNWRDTKINLTTYVGAILRHITALSAGEDLDECGLPHTAHIAASCAILIDAAKHGCLIDDRPKSP